MANTHSSFGIIGVSRGLIMHMTLVSMLYSVFLMNMEKDGKKLSMMKKETMTT